MIFECVVGCRRLPAFFHVVGNVLGRPYRHRVCAARHPDRVSPSRSLRHSLRARGPTAGNASKSAERARVMRDLTLVGAGDRGDHAFTHNYGQRVVSAGRDAGSSALLDECAPRPADTPFGCFQMAGDSDVQEAARKIKCPVLIVHPERDVNVPIAEARLLASLIPDNAGFVQLDLPTTTCRAGG